MSDVSINSSANPDGAAVVSNPAVPASGQDSSLPKWLGLSASVWAQIAVITALMCAVFWPNLRRLWDKTNPFYGEANWGHAICIPFISLYFLYVNRESLLALPVEPLLLPRFPKRRQYRQSVWILCAGLLIYLYTVIVGQFWANAPLTSPAVGMVGSVLVVLGGIIHAAYNFRVVRLSVAMVVCGTLIYWQQPGLAVAVAVVYAIWRAWPLKREPLLAIAGGGLLGSILPYWLFPSFFTSSNVTSAGMGLAVLGAITLFMDWGLGVLLFGLLTYAFGIYPGQNDFVKDVGMVITLFGVVLLLCGWRVMKEVYFAIAFLVCGIPWPGLFYSQVAGPLQQLAAHVAVWTMELTGVQSSVGGTKIFIYGDAAGGAVRTLNVAEACAGLRSLMTFISIGGAVAFLSGRPLWQKLFMTVAAIPIAIFCNVMRVSGQGLLDHYVSQQLSDSFAHQFVGMIMFIPAFLLILLTGWVLDQLFVEEADVRRAAAHKVLRRAVVPSIMPPPVRPNVTAGKPLAMPAPTVSSPVVLSPVPGRSLAARRAQMEQAANATANSPATASADLQAKAEESL